MNILMDIDGMTVGQLREFLDSYSDDDVLEVREEFYRGFGSEGGEQVELHVIEKDEK